LSDEGPRRPLIVPIFIPYQGCPHRCVFCQQEKITARTAGAVDRSYVKETLDTAIDSKGFDAGRDPQVAFYGGTFTRIPIERMAYLLEAVAPYIKQGFFKSIRVSTRPDALDDERLQLMKARNVSTVELGSQSMDEEVLAKTQRGHTARDTVQSVMMLKQYGFKVGIQLMPGLPGDSKEKFMKTVEKVVLLRPDMVRLYPALVIRGTELAGWYQAKRYQPLGLESAVQICSESCMRLESNGIPVIRIGLMSSPSLLQEGQIVAGPWHEAFGFLVRSAIHQQRIEPWLPMPGEAERIGLRVPSREVPLVRGYKNRGLRLIENKTGAEVINVIPDASVSPGRIRVDKDV